MNVEDLPRKMLLRQFAKYSRLSTTYMIETLCTEVSSLIKVGHFSADFLQISSRRTFCTLREIKIPNLFWPTSVLQRCWEQWMKFSRPWLALSDTQHPKSCSVKDMENQQICGPSESSLTRYFVATLRSEVKAFKILYTSARVGRLHFMRDTGKMLVKMRRTSSCYYYNLINSIVRRAR